MTDFAFTPKPSYSYEDLLACGRGEIFGPGNPKLPGCLDVVALLKNVWGVYRDETFGD